MNRSDQERKAGALAIELVEWVEEGIREEDYGSLVGADGDDPIIRGDFGDWCELVRPQLYTKLWELVHAVLALAEVPEPWRVTIAKATALGHDIGDIRPDFPHGIDSIQCKTCGAMSYIKSGRATKERCAG